MRHTVLKNKGATKIIAHRGASGLERENTHSAFVAAGNLSYFGAECDIHVTSDGKFIVYHDDDTGRLCDKKVVVEDTAFDELRSLKIKETDGEGFSDYHKMPTLKEYLGILKRYGKVAVIELKNAMKTEDIARIIVICKENYSLDKIIFISFDYQNLLKVREILPAQPVQFLTGEYSDDLPERLKKDKFDLDVGFWSLSKERVDILRKNGIKVNCWTCDDKDKADELISWGVDFITSNILE